MTIRSKRTRRDKRTGARPMRPEVELNRLVPSSRQKYEPVEADVELNTAESA